MDATWGAPGGIELREAGNRASLASGLQAQKMLGDIAAQPAELQYKQAQARLVGAQATGAETANANALMMLGLDKQFNQEYNARQTLTDAAANSGVTATVADLRNGSATATLAPTSLYDRSIARIKWMEAQGLPESLIAPERDKVATGLEHQSIASYRSAQTGEINFKQQQARLSQIGGIARAASASPEQFAQAMLNPDTAALLPKGMGMLSYEQALPHLTQIYTSAMTSQQQATEANQAQTRTARTLLDQSTIARNAATASAAVARADLTKTYQTNIVKNGGDKSSSAADARDSANTARDNADAAKFRATYQAAPLDPKQWKVGTSYSNADGTKVAKYAGNGQWIPMTVPTPRALRKATAMQQAASTVNAPASAGETADDTGE